VRESLLILQKKSQYFSQWFYRWRRFS